MLANAMRRHVLSRGGPTIENGAWQMMLDAAAELDRVAPSLRGYAAVGLVSPKCDANIGGALRAADCYGAALVVVQGQRYRRQATDTTEFSRHRPLLRTDDLRNVIPRGCVPVAVDLVDGAQDLRNYKHPERAFYIFGPEDGSLDEKILSWCRDKIMVPTRRCMNLAATVNVILYDRMAKNSRLTAIEARLDAEAR